jgi:hypothetical protein
MQKTFTGDLQPIELRTNTSDDSLQTVRQICKQTYVRKRDLWLRTMTQASACQRGQKSVQFGQNAPNGWRRRKLECSKIHIWHIRSGFVRQSAKKSPTWNWRGTRRARRTLAFSTNANSNPIRPTRADPRTYREALLSPARTHTLSSCPGRQEYLCVLTTIVNTSRSINRL